MPGLLAIFRKELADHLGSLRFIILLTLIILAGLVVTYVAGQTIREAVKQVNTSTSFVFLILFSSASKDLPISFVTLVSFLGPLAGLALGFDAINSERSSGTMSRVLSQPVHRDSVINGKFLAGLATVALMLASVMLILSGMGLSIIGIPPTGEEIVRLIAFFIVSVFYVAFWMALSVLFSTIFRQAATSALAGIAVWIFLGIFFAMIAGMIANAIVPVTSSSTPDVNLDNYNWQNYISRLSPTTLYQEATRAFLNPWDPDIRTFGLSISSLMSSYGMIITPLSAGQSFLVVWPQITGLICLTIICFAIAYTVFMREEIRS